MRRKFYLVMMIICFAVTNAHANIDNLMDSIVTGVTVSKPGVYKSPSRTTASLGSMNFRLNTSALTEPLVTFTPPRATLSCAGMDFDAGQLSMLNMSMIEDMVSNFGGQAAWGVIMGLVYSTPGISEGLSKLNEITRWSQALTQSPCEIGMALGQSAGKKIWGEKTTDAAENSVGVGSFSIFGEALKKVKQNMKQQDVFQTFPYGILQKAGLNDKEIMNLFATWFGVIDVYLVDSNGDRMSYVPGANLSNCGSKPCDENNIRSIKHEAKIADLDVFIYGGKTSLYECSGSILSGVCTGDITLQKDVNVKGIKQIIIQNIKSMRNALSTPYTGALSGLATATVKAAIENQDNASALYTYSAMIPNFFDVLSYSALLAKSPDSGLNNVADEMIEDMAEVMAYRLIDKFFGMSHDYLSQAITADPALMTKATESINTYMENALKSYDRIQTMMERANQKSVFYEQAARRYQSYYDYTSKKLMTSVNGIQIKK